MLKLLYDSQTDYMDAILDSTSELIIPDGMRIMLLTKTAGFPEKAAGTKYEGSVHKSSTRTDYVPGLSFKGLFNALYSDCDAPRKLTLYHDGMNLCAATESLYETTVTVIRLMPCENYQKLWEHMGRTDKKSWYKLMRHTVAIQDAMPEIMDVLRPCRLVPIAP